MLQQNLYVAAKHWRKILQRNFMLHQNPKPIIRFASSFLKPATINSIHSFIPENRKPHIHPIYFLLKFRHELFNPFQGF
jgi:hypothetical protein